LTEVPEHLLARSRERRAAAGAGGAEAAASTPATTGSSAPEAAAAATPAKPEPASVPVPSEPEPVAPWVEAAGRRRKIPYWAVPVLAMLPLWAVIYALTLDEPTPTEPGPLELGAEIYQINCSGCHGAGGGGAGAVPALIGENDSSEVFPRPAEQVRWIALGTAGYSAEGLETYGEGAPRQVGGNGVMPAWLDSLTYEELMSVVFYVRSGLNDEAFEAEVWEQDFEELLAEHLPAERVPGFVEVLEEWVAEPPES
jgi:mono/diheme cytochrome c family protein